MRKKWKAAGANKEFSDLINPLRRALRKNVGRPWDKVYSEIVKTLPDGIVSRHILQHVGWEVITNVVIRDRAPYYGPGSFFGRALRRGALYVNPTTGLLCAAKG